MHGGSEVAQRRVWRARALAASGAAAALAAYCAGAAAQAPEPTRAQRLAASALGACLRQQPPYPPEALRSDWTGRTMVAFSIADDGTPDGAELATSSGHALLDAAALTHVRHCMATARARTPAETLPSGTFRVPYVWRIE
jgi:TonB family protein